MSGTPSNTERAEVTPEAPPAGAETSPVQSVPAIDPEAAGGEEGAKEKRYFRAGDPVGVYPVKPTG